MESFLVSECKSGFVFQIKRSLVWLDLDKSDETSDAHAGSYLKFCSLTSDRERV